jgi:hypothetical protein
MQKGQTPTGEIHEKLKKKDEVEDFTSDSAFSFNSAGKTRTYNPSVTHCPMFSHRGGLSHQLSSESRRALVGRYWMRLLNP